MRLYQSLRPRTDACALRFVTSCLLPVAHSQEAAHSHRVSPALPWSLRALCLPPTPSADHIITAWCVPPGPVVPVLMVPP